MKKVRPDQIDALPAHPPSSKPVVVSKHSVKTKKGKPVLCHCGIGFPNQTDLISHVGLSHKGVSFKLSNGWARATC